jgi:phospholipase D-like protein
MTKDKLIKISFGIALFCIVSGIAIKLLHISFPIPVLLIGIIFSVIYTVIVIQELLNSNRISSAEKVMWIVGFLFFNTFTVILYFASRRKMITGTFKVLNF